MIREIRDRQLDNLQNFFRTMEKIIAESNNVHIPIKEARNGTKVTFSRLRDGLELLFAISIARTLRARDDYWR